MAEDLFAKLSGGLRFDRKKNQDMGLFGLGDDDQAGKNKGKKTYQPPPSFFATAAPAPAAAVGATKKKEAAAEKRKMDASAQSHQPANKKAKVEAKPQKKEEEEKDEHLDSEKEDEAVASEEEELKEDEDELEEEVSIFQSPVKKSEAEKRRKAKEEEEAEAKAQKPEVIRLRKEFGIRVRGKGVPEPIAQWTDLKDPAYGFQPQVLRNLAAANMDAPTPIQMQAIPAMSLGREIIGVAPTGSGKTLAYVLPIIKVLDRPKRQGFRAVVLSPTKELAQQIYRVFKRFSEGIGFRVAVLTASKAATSEGGVEEQKERNKRFDILVSPPLRMVHMLKEGTLSLAKVRVLVFDEADRLFDEEFLGQVDDIAAAAAAGKTGAASLQVCLFSATMHPKVEQLASSLMRDPVRITVGMKNVPLPTIKQKLMFVGQEDGKLIAMRQLVQQGIKPPVIIFVQSRDRAKDLFHQLVYDGVNVDVIHADRTPAQRRQIVDSFRAGKIWFLIATDVMARGMDFKGVSCVINYDFPTTVTSYIHRIGRTGRAGMPGEAITFFTEEDTELLKLISSSMKEAGCEVPDWMLSLKKVSREKKKRLAVRPPERHAIGSTPAVLKGAAARLPGKKSKKSKDGKKKKAVDKKKEVPEQQEEVSEEEGIQEEAQEESGEEDPMDEEIPSDDE